jgi:DNA-binding SARP family transcriptional activator/tetratricopeptide (TPR) repeat protein
VADLEFRVLGPLEVLAGGQDRTPRPAKLRLLLALLLVHAPDRVPVGSLIDDLWDDDPPPTATTALQVYVSQLRKLLDPGRGARDPDQVLRTARPGYQLDIDPQRCDLHRFGALADRGAARLAGGDAAGAADAYAEGLRLWRGPLLVDVAARSLHAVHRPALKERWLDAHERYAEARLALGRAGPVVDDLTPIVAENPLREGLVGVLMSALVGTGRRTDALRLFARTRTTLAEELGIDPSRDLRVLGERIRSGEAVGGARPAAPAAAPVAPSVPSRLPPAAADFTGRDAAVAEVAAALRGTRAATAALACCEIVGPGGVGKTTLAVQSAHAVRADFPDGQLVADLAGVDDRPADPAEVLREFLLQLGVNAGTLPRSMDERSRLFRSMTSGRRMLLLLDDAASERQVRPLLPGSASCAVLITGRRRLLGLEQVHTVDLDVLEPDGAMALLGRLIGPARVAGEPGAAAEILTHCGLLPLAVRIAGARLSAQPRISLAAFAQSLADERGRLDLLAAGDFGVRSSIALSYRGCRELEQRGLRVLGAVGLAEFPAWVLAGLLDVDVRTGTEAVELLVDAQLVAVAAVDALGEVRYRLHELVRLYAAELAAADPPERVTAGIQRVGEAFADLLGRAERAAHPGAQQRPGPVARWSVDDALLAGIDADPLTWAANESRTVLGVLRLAHAARLWPVAVRLAARITWIVDLLSDWSGRRTAVELGLDAAGRAGDDYGTAAMLRRRADLEWDLGHAGPAVADLARARLLHRRLGDRHGEALSLLGLAAVYTDRGPLSRAQALLDQAQPVLEAVGDRRGQAEVVRFRGLLHRDRGELAAAGECLAAAAAIFAELGDERWWAYVSRGLVRLRRQQGRLVEAEQLAVECVATFRRLSDQRWEGYALFSLAEVDLDLRRLGAAERRLQHCVELFGAVGDHRAIGQALCQLGEVRRMGGAPDEAVRVLAEAIEMIDEEGDPRAMALAALAMGRAHRDAGRPGPAARWIGRSAEIYHRVGLSARHQEALDELRELHAGTPAG